MSKQIPNEAELKKDIFVGLDYLKRLLKYRISTHFQATEEELLWPEMPDFRRSQTTVFTTFLEQGELDQAELVVVLCALASEVDPSFFDTIIKESIPSGGDFPELGGIRGKQFRGFLPTGETVLFLLAGRDMAYRLELQNLFSSNHFFVQQRIIWLDDPPAHEPRMSGRLCINPEYIDLLTLGYTPPPRFSMKFPAQRIETRLDWGDLVLPEQTVQRIKELKAYLTHGTTLMEDWEVGKRMKPGFRTLFHGPPGTGKTLTASLLGKETGRDTYKVDLSMIVSKYIGETEKNLANLFAAAENKGWILFFDEADALFGKRTNVRDAHDKYANQEVSYLLQRIETYNGLVILASNFKNNIDKAFIRRFQSIIDFPFPQPSERLQLWEKAWPGELKLNKGIQLRKIAQQYELSGAEIINVVQYLCLRCLDKGDNTIQEKDILRAIRQEFSKEGKMI